MIYSLILLGFWGMFAISYLLVIWFFTDKNKSEREVDFIGFVFAYAGILALTLKGIFLGGFI